MLYCPSREGPLRQGEILSNIIRLQVEDIQAAPPSVVPEKHPFAIIISQDCDLETDHRNRQEAATSLADAESIPINSLRSVLFLEVDAAENLKSSYGLSSKDWTRIKKGENTRYQILQNVAPDNDALAEGIPAMGIDFKRYFSLPMDELLKRIELEHTRRRCYMQSPYFEQLTSRFLAYFGRIGLPSPHDLTDV